MYVVIAAMSDSIDNWSTVVSIHHTLQQAQYSMRHYRRNEYQNEIDIEDFIIEFDDQSVVAYLNDKTLQDDMYQVSISSPWIPLVSPTIPPYKMEWDKVVENNYPF